MAIVTVDTGTGTIRTTIAQLTGPENLQQWSRGILLALRALNLCKYIVPSPARRTGKLVWSNSIGELVKPHPGHSGYLVYLSEQEWLQQAQVMFLVDSSISPEVRALLVENGWDENNLDPNVLYVKAHQVLQNQPVKEKQAEQAERRAKKEPEKDAENNRPSSSRCRPSRGYGEGLRAVFSNLNIAGMGQGSSSI